jgi:cell division protein FtsQ
MENMNSLKIGKVDFIESDLFYEEKNPKKSQSDDRTWKIVKVLFFILCFIIFLEFVIYKYIKPCFSIPKFDYVGNASYSEEVNNTLKNLNYTTWIKFDVDNASKAIKANPSVASVMVVKKFPNKVFYDIKERHPVAITFVQDGDTSYPIQIDESGYFFPVNKQKSFENLPILSGIPVEYIADGMSVPNEYRPLLNQISKIAATDSSYFACLSEICVVPKSSGGYELVLIPAQSKTRVHMDRSLNIHSLEYMMVVLDVIQQLGQTVSEVDIRYQSVSIR